MNSIYILKSHRIQMSDINEIIEIRSLVSCKINNFKLQFKELAKKALLCKKLEIEFVPISDVAILIKGINTSSYMFGTHYTINKIDEDGPSVTYLNNCFQLFYDEKSFDLDHAFATTMIPMSIIYEKRNDLEFIIERIMNTIVLFNKCDINTTLIYDTIIDKFEYEI